MPNNNSGNDPWTFRGAKQLLYASRGEVDDEASWWQLEKTLNDVRDASNPDEKKLAMVDLQSHATAVKYSQQRRREADKKERRCAPWIPLVALVIVGVAFGWFGKYVGAQISSSGVKDASSLLKHIVFGTGLCTAIISFLAILLNSWKIVNPSEAIKKYVETSLLTLSWGTLCFTLMALFFNQVL